MPQQDGTSLGTLRWSGMVQRLWGTVGFAHPHLTNAKPVLHEQVLIKDLQTTAFLNASLSKFWIKLKITIVLTPCLHPRVFLLLFLGALKAMASLQC